MRVLQGERLFGELLEAYDDVVARGRGPGAFGHKGRAHVAELGVIEDAEGAAFDVDRVACVEERFGGGGCQTTSVLERFGLGFCYSLSWCPGLGKTYLCAEVEGWKRHGDFLSSNWSEKDLNCIRIGLIVVSARDLTQASCLVR